MQCLVKVDKMTLHNKTAWFSSSVRDTIVNTWADAGGIVTQDALDAEYLFSSNSDSDDMKRLFKTKSFLAGRLTILSPDLIRAIVDNEFDFLDVRKYIILPYKKLTEFLPLSMNHVNKSRSNNNHQTEVDKNKSSEASSETSSGSLPVSPKSVDDSSNVQTINGKDDCISSFYNEFDSGVLLKDIRHLGDLCVKPVCLMDFRPGVNGCRVVKTDRAKHCRKK